MQRSTGFLWVVALASAGVSAGLWMNLRAERELTAELRVRLDRAIEPSPATPVAAPAATPKIHSTTSIAVAEIPASAAANQPAHRTSFTQEEWMASQRRLLSDPRYREAWFEQQRLQQAGYRERLIDLLGFSAEQADVVIDLGIERQLTWQFQTPPDPMTEEYLREQKERAEAAQRTEKARLREVLGEAKYARFQDYLESSMSRQQVDRLRTQLSGADALRDDQIEPLIAAIHAEQAQMSKDMLAYRDTLSWDGDSSASMQKLSERQTEEIKAVNARIRNAAGAILGSGQLEQLDAMLKRDLASHEAQVRMQRIQSKVDPRP